MATQGGVADGLLSQVAEDIQTGEQMEALGRTLGFRVADINRYTETNRIEGRVTCKGTRDMLFDWRQTVEPCDQHIRLKQALIDAELIMLAGTHLKSTPIISGGSNSAIQSALNHLLYLYTGAYAGGGGGGWTPLQLFVCLFWRKIPP